MANFNPYSHPLNNGFRTICNSSGEIQTKGPFQQSFTSQLPPIQELTYRQPGTSRHQMPPLPPPSVPAGYVRAVPRSGPSSYHQSSRPLAPPSSSSSSSSSPSLVSVEYLTTKIMSAINPILLDHQTTTNARLEYLEQSFQRAIQPLSTDVKNLEVRSRRDTERIEELLRETNVALRKSHVVQTRSVKALVDRVVSMEERIGGGGEGIGKGRRRDTLVERLEEVGFSVEESLERARDPQAAFDEPETIQRRDATRAERTPESVTLRPIVRHDMGTSPIKGLSDASESSSTGGCSGTPSLSVQPDRDVEMETTFYEDPNASIAFQHPGPPPRRNTLTSAPESTDNSRNGNEDTIAGGSGSPDRSESNTPCQFTPVNWSMSTGTLNRNTTSSGAASVAGNTPAPPFFEPDLSLEGRPYFAIPFEEGDNGEGDSERVSHGAVALSSESHVVTASAAEDNRDNDDEGVIREGEEGEGEEEGAGEERSTAHRGRSATVPSSRSPSPASGFDFDSPVPKATRTRLFSEPPAERENTGAEIEVVVETNTNADASENANDEVNANANVNVNEGEDQEEEEDLFGPSARSMPSSRSPSPMVPAPESSSRTWTRSCMPPKERVIGRPLEGMRMGGSGADANTSARVTGEVQAQEDRGKILPLPSLASDVEDDRMLDVTRTTTATTTRYSEAGNGTDVDGDGGGEGGVEDDSEENVVAKMVMGLSESPLKKLLFSQESVSGGVLPVPDAASFTTDDVVKSAREEVGRLVQSLREGMSMGMEVEMKMMKYRDLKGKGLGLKFSSEESSASAYTYDYSSEVVENMSEMSELTELSSVDDDEEENNSDGDGGGAGAGAVWVAGTSGGIGTYDGDGAKPPKRRKLEHPRREEGLSSSVVKVKRERKSGASANAGPGKKRVRKQKARGKGVGVGGDAKVKRESASVSGSSGKASRKSAGGGTSRIKWPGKVVDEHGSLGIFIRCDTCLLWYHCGCVGLVSDDPQVESEVYSCPPCASGKPLSRAGRRGDQCSRPDCTAQLVENEFFVSRIIGRTKVASGLKSYLWLIRWQNYSVQRSTWEPVESLGGDYRLIENFRNDLMEEGIEDDTSATLLLQEAVEGGWNADSPDDVPPSDLEAQA